MKDLHISVTGKVATYSARDGFIVCENEGQYQIVFTFDSEWDAYTKKVARFIWNGQYKNVDFTGTTCPVPPITAAERVLVGVYAGDLCTTTPAVIECVSSILSAPGSEVDGSPVVNGNSAFIRYSAYADGTDFTEEWVEGQDYIGFAVGQSAPTDKSGYTWALFRGENVNVVQGKGDSTTEAMSQAATTSELNAMGYKIDYTNSLTEEELDDRANAIKGQASGSVAAMANVSPVSHTVKVGLRSKNLWTTNLTYPTGNLDYNAETQVYTFSGACNATLYTLPEPIPAGTPVAISVEVLAGNVTSAHDGGLAMGGYHKSASGAASWQGYVNFPKLTNEDIAGQVYTESFVTTETVTNFYAFIYASTATIHEPLQVRIQYEIGIEATTFTPYVAPGEIVTVRSCGKNLLTYQTRTAAETVNGVTFTPYPDGTVRAVGTATADATLVITRQGFEKCYIPAGSYYFSGCPGAGECKMRLALTDESNINFFEKDDFGDGLKVDIATPAEKVYIKIYVTKGSDVDVTFKPMLELGTEATSYEPYVGASGIASVGVDDRFLSIAPVMNVYAETPGVIVDAEYNLDTAAAVSAMAGVPMPPVYYDDTQLAEMVESSIFYSYLNLPIPVGASAVIVRGSAAALGVMELGLASVGTPANFNKVASIQIDMLDGGISTEFCARVPLMRLDATLFASYAADVFIPTEGMGTVTQHEGHPSGSSFCLRFTSDDPLGIFSENGGLTLRFT